MSSTAVGDWLEEQVFDFVVEEVKKGTFFFQPENCKVFRRKGYYSVKRQGDIVFDVSIEVGLPGADTYSMLIIIECKNYRHAVPVDDLEEFGSKLDQVAGSKGILVTTAELQRGALNFAKSSRMGVVRFVEGDLKWVLYRSVSSAIYRSPESQRYYIEQSMLDKNLSSKLYDIHAVSGGVFTNSWREVFENLLADELAENDGLAGLVSECDRSSFVEYVDKVQIESCAFSVLESIGYTNGRVSLSRIANNENSASGLRVVAISRDSPYLGCIDFSVNEIGVVGGLNGCDERGRFTLSHELGHFYLGHSRYMLREGCDESDVDLDEPSGLIVEDVKRLEWQANYFASCLLLPKDDFLSAFSAVTRYLRISDKGRGALYLDSQGCNYDSYMQVTDFLRGRFDVSRSAVKYRLLGLGLLNDVRGRA